MISRPYLINSSKSTARGEAQEKLEKTHFYLKKKKKNPPPICRIFVFVTTAILEACFEFVTFKRKKKKSFLMYSLK